MKNNQAQSWNCEKVLPFCDKCIKDFLVYSKTVSPVDVIQRPIVGAASRIWRHSVDINVDIWHMEEEFSVSRVCQAVCACKST